ncbi:hypothetical protein CB1_000849035 [Camelus ferus]|nr:hypothetical protein CB1_000849035 [Camelus ferus]
MTASWGAYHPRKVPSQSGGRKSQIKVTHVGMSSTQELGTEGGSGTHILAHRQDGAVVPCPDRVRAPPPQQPWARPPDTPPPLRAGGDTPPPLRAGGCALAPPPHRALLSERCPLSVSSAAGRQLPRLDRLPTCGDVPRQVAVRSLGRQAPPSVHPRCAAGGCL